MTVEPGLVFVGRHRPTVTIAVNVYKPAEDTLTPQPWTNVARMVAHLTHANTGALVTVDTAQTPAAITWPQDGVLVFDFGALFALASIPEGDYETDLVVIDIGGEETELISRQHPTQRLTFRVLPTLPV